MPAAPAYPLFATAPKAARLLDMRTKEFRRLVDQGALPGPGKFDRWDVEQLKKIMRGETARSQQGLEV